MLRDSIKEWLADHPRVLAAAFGAGIYLSQGIDILKEGGTGGYNGP